VITEDSSVLRALAECTTGLSSSRFCLIAIARGEGKWQCKIQDTVGSRVRCHRAPPETFQKHDGRWAKLSDAVSDTLRMKEGHYPGYIYEVQVRVERIAALRHVTSTLSTVPRDSAPLRNHIFIFIEFLQNFLTYFW
jgi:hypothetical protein